MFFYRLSKRLKFEIELNKRINQELLKSKEELLVSNEKLIQLSQFKEDFTNMIVHDLKTPLNAIIHAKLFQDENMIQQSGYTMLNLVQNMLDVYRYKESIIELSKRRVKLIEIISAARKEIDFSANQKSLTLRISKKIIAL